jgi:hypothetical protein
MTQVLQYAYNIFGSISPMIYLYLGAAFAIFVVARIIKVAKGE